MSVTDRLHFLAPIRAELDLYPALPSVPTQAPLFGRTHQRMLRALYPPTPTPTPAAPAPAALVLHAPSPTQPPQPPQPPRPEEGDEIWGRVNAFLDDAGGLMALRVQLLATRAAEPWMAPVPMPAAAAAAGGGGRQVRGWVYGLDWGWVCGDWTGECKNRTLVLTRLRQTTK